MAPKGQATTTEPRPVKTWEILIRTFAFSHFTGWKLSLYRINFFAREGLLLYSVKIMTDIFQ